MAPQRRKRPRKPTSSGGSPTPAGGPPSSEPKVQADPVLPFPVVGVGASAGGVEAATDLLKALPSDTGMAFVMVHHLAPGRASMLAEILARATSMPVRTVEDHMPVTPDHVYVIPPGTGIELRDGSLSLLPRSKADGGFRPIDQFFRSLAVEQGYRAIGVVLSGTASDGTAGCEEIKAEGGITFAQDDSAQQEGMPHSAIATGCVDFVLPPQKIAERIAEIGKHPVVRPHRRNRAARVEDRLASILETVRRRTGMDFSHYKRSTVLRRLARRMVLNRIPGFDDYDRFLAGNPLEAEALFQDILINVTSFFRNPEGFELLKKQVFPELVRDRSRHLPVRIWVLGCATGEEAYSVAIAFAEFAADQGRAIPVQIFASDLSHAGIDKARAGFYPKTIEQNISPARLRRFFVESDGGYRISKTIRDMVVFARHNAIADPPFSHLDLITCRNLLIYLDTMLQQRLIPILHYALSPGGFLWLGQSETVGPFRNLFEPVEAGHKLYQRKPVPPELKGLVGRADAAVPKPGQVPERIARTRPTLDPEREAERLLLSRYAPPGVLVDSSFEVIHYRGDTSPYLTPSPGRASPSLIKMLREGLLPAVRAALLRARREGRPVRQDNIPLRGDGAPRKVRVEVIPIQATTMRESCYLVLFDDATSARARARPAPAPRPSRVPRGEPAAAEVLRLRQELTATREYLQSVIEQQEAANEELQSANEEVQSTNEELQSINEELETSKEEIQSSSEELATVNDELSNRNLELSRSNNDLINLISSVQVPIVMLGPDFRIRRFTPSAERVLNLIASDLGRPITDIKPNVELPGLEAMLAEVVETVASREQLVRDRSGRWYALRLRPYRTMDNRIDGVVMMLVDIHAVKEAEESVRRNAERLVILQDQAPLGIREVDLDGRYLRVNQRYCDITGYRREELSGRHFTDFLHPEDRTRAEELTRRVQEGELPSYRDERRQYRKDGRLIWVEVHGFALRDENGKPMSGVAFVQDITERRRAQEELTAADRAKNEFLAMLAHELRNPLAPLLHAAQLLGASGLDAERIEALRGILERQIRSLSRMTDDLLDVSRISRGQIRIHPEVVDLGAIVRRAVELFQPTIVSRQQLLEVAIGEEPLQLLADPVRIEQAVDNLLTNASKFTPPEGRIRISLGRVSDPPPGAIELRVRDEGRGIAPELLPRIFDPFVQAEQSLDRTQGGLGIGLTLVRHIARLHGGTVEARSEGAGRGSEFVVRLPLAPLPPEPTPERRRPVDASRKHRILIVDDNPDAAETLALLLRHRQHQVEIAHDGDEAMEKMQEFVPGIVLLDIGLPGKDGIEVARTLRARDPRLHIVAVSGYGQEGLRARARDAGIEHYFTKPVDIGSLVRLFAVLG